ncbi:MAG: NmrA family NAD(P)-binding protein [Spirochaetaceae bacterium]
MITPGNTVLVLGATGNVGGETVKAARALGLDVRETRRPGSDLPESAVAFDFLDPATYSGALAGVTRLFLLRPPHISNVERDMRPFLEAVAGSAVERVVFLSLQGAESRSYLPHRKIELLLEQLQIPSTFLRPAFFMENLSTTHRQEISERSRITVPAGAAKFNFVSCTDIGKAAAVCLADSDPRRERYRSYVLTGPENLAYGDVARILSEVSGRAITYRSPGPVRHYFLKRRDGASRGFALVMTMLYYSRRFGGDPEISADLEMLIGEKPRSLRDFARTHREDW